MEKFIPFNKLSKKKQRELAAQKRGAWGGLSPVTRKAKNPKAYNRKKAREWSEDSITVPSFLPRGDWSRRAAAAAQPGTGVPVRRSAA